MIRTSTRLRLCTALLLCNLVFIWGNSLLPAELSQAFSDWVKGILLFWKYGSGGGTGGSGLLRKIAHFAEFTTLGALLSWHFGMRNQKQYLPLVCGITAACIDETIQMFVPERGPGIRDVLIDSSGVLTGMFLIHLGHTYFKKKSTKQYSEE